MKDGSIFISNDDDFCENAFVQISPDQVDILVAWLKSAKQEAIATDEHPVER
ncbi:MAG: hypothetical protein AB7N24_22570 [Dehalococcoidia bacterium]